MRYIPSANYWWSRQLRSAPCLQRGVKGFVLETHFFLMIRNFTFQSYTQEIASQTQNQQPLGSAFDQTSGSIGLILVAKI
jgi:hypothetical protein